MPYQIIKGSSHTDEFLTEFSLLLYFTRQYQLLSIDRTKSGQRCSRVAEQLNELRRNEVDDTCDTVPVSITTYEHHCTPKDRRLCVVLPVAHCRQRNDQRTGFVGSGTGG